MKITEKLKPIVNSQECENMVKHLEDQNNVDKWTNNPLLANYLKSNNTAGQDIVAGIEELSSTILSIRRPASIGQSLVRRFNSMRETIKVRSPIRGKGVKTNRAGVDPLSKGQRQGFITLTADEEFENSDEWDRAYVETAEYNVMAAQTQELGQNHTEDISQYLVDQVKSVKTADSAGLVAFNNSATLTPDMLITAWGNILSQNGDANSLVMHPDRAVDLLKNSEMKNQLVLGQFANYSEGRLGMFLGMQIYLSTQVPKREAYAFDKSRYLWGLWRRDRLVVPFTPGPNRTLLSITSRLGTLIADPKICSPIRAT